MARSALRKCDTDGPARLQSPNRPLLAVESDSHRRGPASVNVSALDPDLMASLARYLRGGGSLQCILRVAVVRAGAPFLDDLPGILGRHQLLEDGVRFIPHFPFEAGLFYRATFDPRPLGGRDLSDVLTLAFSSPRQESGPPAKVRHIYPSSDRLPENLLRFYIDFSKPMRRGHVEAEIKLLGPDGAPAPDALYRAPVELWDRSMQRLTILLDPGRLKRGVGPNRQLGPPLKAGEAYTMVIGAGMTDLYGDRLPEPVYKRFRVADAIREPVAVEQWEIASPRTNSRQPLTLIFPRPLDRALLSHAITVASAEGQAIHGQIAIDGDEAQWRLTPTSPWAPGAYSVRVASCLEDVCGNSVIAAFDRSLRTGGDFTFETIGRSIPFCLV
jgi:hypothetical protein